MNPPTDQYGRRFDERLHATDKNGAPLLNVNGRLVIKRPVPNAFRDANRPPEPQRMLRLGELTES